MTDTSTGRPTATSSSRHSGRPTAKTATPARIASETPLYDATVGSLGIPGQSVSLPPMDDLEAAMRDLRSLAEPWGAPRT